MPEQSGSEQPVQQQEIVHSPSKGKTLQEKPDFPVSVTFIAAAVFPLVAFLAWSDSFSTPFLQDDNWNLLNNPGLEKLWPPWLPGAGSVHTGLAGRPVTAFSFALNRAISGGSAFSYHVGNLIIHILAGLTLFGLLRSMFRQADRNAGKKLDLFSKEADWLAFFCALIWLVHPLTIQSVTYITQRLESLAGLFYLLVLSCAAKSLEPGQSKIKRLGFGMLSVAAFMLGVGSKEVIVTAPFAVFLYEWVVTQKKAPVILRQSIGRYMGYALGLILLGALVSTGQTAQHAYVESASFPWLDYALFQPRVIWHYLRLAFLPYGYCFCYGYHQADAMNVFYGSLAGKLAWTAALCIPISAAVFLVVKRRLAGLALSLFFLILIPTSSILTLVMVAEEQRMYLPLAALMALSTAGGYFLLRKNGSSGKTCAVLGMLVVVALGVLTFERNLDFKSDRSIWLSTLAATPNNPNAYAALGEIAETAGNLELAETLYEKALSVYPQFGNVRIHLGVVLAKMGRLDEAYNQCLEVLIHPSPFSNKTEKAQALSTIGKILFYKGKFKEAGAFLNQALALEPHYPQAISNLGVLLAVTGETDKALETLKRALAANPGLIEPHIHLARIYMEQGRISDAQQHMVQARSLAPNNPELQKLEQEFKR